MAITPNVNFVAGAVLTAQQQNNFGRGVMSVAFSTASVGFASETTIITAPAFTAVASRYYRITFFQPSMTNGAAGYAVMKIKNGATVLNTSQPQQFNAASGYEGQCQAVTTFSAGSVTITGTLQSTTSGATTNTATQYGFLLIEDIGTA